MKQMIKTLEFVCMLIASAIAGISLTTQDNQLIGIYWMLVGLYWVVRLNQRGTEK